MANNPWLSEVSINTRMANSKPNSPYFKRIHPNQFKQALSRKPNSNLSWGHSTNQKTTNRRLIRIGTDSLQKDYGGLVKQSLIGFNPKPHNILVETGGAIANVRNRIIQTHCEHKHTITPKPHQRDCTSATC